MAQFYRVGGCVRDEILGLEAKDIDYAVEAKSFDDMRDAIIARGGKIYLETPEYLTIRAKVPEIGDADFVLCRKDGQYKDGRHPETVEPGTLYDDLSRRDFTMNAMALEGLGRDTTLIDPFGGYEDLKAGMIYCVGAPHDRFNEDALRMLRAMRFALTKKMQLHTSITQCLEDGELLDLLKTISVERVREELQKCFKFDTIATLKFLADFPGMRDACFADRDLWLMPTMKGK